MKKNSIKAQSQFFLFHFFFTNVYIITLKHHIHIQNNWKHFSNTSKCLNIYFLHMKFLVWKNFALEIR